MATEKTLQQSIVKKLKAEGWLVYKLSSPAHRGVPDLLCLKDSQVLFLEVKHPNGRGRLSKLQEITINDMKEKGAKVYVVNSLPGALQAAAECLR